MSMHKPRGEGRTRWLLRSASALCGALAITAGAGVMASPSAMAACSNAANPGVDWSGCRKRALIVNGTDFSEARLERTDFTGSDMRDTNLTSVNLGKATLTRSSIGGAKVLNASMSGVEGIRMGAAKTEFQAVDMTKSMFFRAVFTEAVFRDVNFSKAEFSRANFTGALLENTSLEYSNMSRAVFLAAKFKNVNLGNAWTYLTDFSGVDLTGTTGLTQQQLDQACGDSGTVLPDGLARPATWPCNGEDN